MFKKLMGQVPTVVIAAATAAIFGGGGAYAAAQITSAQIKDQTIQSRDIAAEGVGTSELRNQSIQSGDIGEGGVGRSEIRDGEIRGADLNRDTLATFMEGREALEEVNENKDAWSEDKIGMTDDEKAEYATKADEDARADKVGLNTSRAGAGYTKFAAPGYSVQFAQCKTAGTVAISGGYRLNGHASEAFSGADQNPMPEGLSVVATEPAGVVNGELVNTYQHPDFPQTDGGSFQANAWAVTFKNDSNDPKPVRVWATCVSAN